MRLRIKRALLDWSPFVFASRRILFFFLFTIITGCGDGGPGAPAYQSGIEISKNIPDRFVNSSLRLKISNLVGDAATNRQMWTGSRSLKSPLGSVSSVDGSNRYSFEERLVSIKTNGFVILFSKNENGLLTTNMMLFRYGETNQTNALGLDIIGQFE